MSSLLSFSSLSAAEFRQAAFSPLPTVAVFDCDGTLWAGDAGSGFMQWTIESGLVSREVVDSIDRRYRGYLRGDISELAICGEMVQMYQGLQESELRRAAQLFVAQRVHSHIFPVLRDLIVDLIEAGVEIWAVSSTNNWVIEEGVRTFGIPPQRVLAAKVAITGGAVTNLLLDVPTDDGKVTALHAAGVLTPDAVFGNSVHDAAMLSIARRPFAVNPSPALAEQAKREGWPVYRPETI